MLSELRKLGVAPILEEAAALIQEKGLARQMHQDPETGEVDVEGAVMLACGAETVSVLVPHPSSIIPPANVALYMATMDVLDAAVPCRYISEWTDQMEVTQEQVVELLRSLASEVSSSIVDWQ